MRIPSLVLALSLLGLAPGALAAVFVVDQTADDVDVQPGDGLCRTAFERCSLRAAVMEANALAGPDEIRLPAGVHTLSRKAALPDASAATGDLDVTDALAIRGASRETTVVAPADADVFRERGLDVAEGVSLALSDVAIAGFRMRRVDDDAGTIDDGLGGCIRSAGALDLAEVDIQDCWTDRFGGGLASQGSVEGVAVRMLRNAAVEGGGVRTAGTLVLRDSLFEDNVAEEEDCGGLDVTGGQARVVRSVFFSNSGDDAGAGCVGGLLELIETLVLRNASELGGGFRVFRGGELWIERSTFAENSATFQGGGLAIDGGRVVIRNSTFSGNRGDLGGGGAIHGSPDSLEIVASTFTRNSTITPDGGAAFAIDLLSSMSIQGSVVAGNLAERYGFDPPGVGLPDDCVRGSRGYNVIGACDSSFFTFHPTDLVGPVAAPIDARLQPLSDAGSPTPVHEPWADSPVVDFVPPEACEVEQDQRGVPRPQGVGCEAGAFERVAAVSSDCGRGYAEAAVPVLAVGVAGALRRRRAGRAPGREPQ